ncbi:GntR family transcriptional regulator [Afifella sp. IM 167]|uniref:GntR family transcriptional regulator n=1 Tax=Afifella sp. IM 167 TaxID=2033586 RepID=UPI001CCC8EC6
MDKTDGQQKRQRDKGIAKGGAAEHAYNVIREEIILRLAPGSDLDDALLVSKLKLSRTPVREALARLAGERLVQLLPNRGARVAPMGWNEIREHLEALDLVQRLVARWAAARRTEAQLAEIERSEARFEQIAAKEDGAAMIEENWQFHGVIAEACGNSIIAGMCKQILTQGLRVDRVAMFHEYFGSDSTYKNHIATIIEDHRKIVKAIRDQDLDAAEHFARLHTETARRRYSEAISGRIEPQMEVALNTTMEVI